MREREKFFVHSICVHFFLQLGFVCVLAVTEEFKEQRVGSALLTQFLRQTPNAVYAYVRATQQLAITFYERHGFMRWRLARHYYQAAKSDELHHDAAAAAADRTRDAWIMLRAPLVMPPRAQSRVSFSRRLTDRQ